MLLTREELNRLIGREVDLDEVSRKLAYFVSGLKAKVVGAHHVTCSDEAGQECVDAFKTQFVKHLLPSFKYWSKAAFLTANLGGRYEWGGVPIAEGHYATKASDEGFKVLLIKVNSHVSVESGPDGPTYGRMARYGTESLYCGALHSLMDGEDLPAVHDLRSAWLAEDPERLQKLLDENVVPARQRSLVAALVNARVQARRAVLDIQNHEPRSPTLYVVVPCVALNRAERDTEIICGLYYADFRTADSTVEYTGLADDPAAYTVDDGSSRIKVSDGNEAVTRSARDHRDLIADLVQGNEESLLEHPEMSKVLRQVEEKRHHENAVPILKSLLGMLAVLAPVPAALLLFAHGAAGIQHVYKAHRLARQRDREDLAHDIINHVEARAHRMPNERARDLVDRIASHLRGRS